jgi:hypothetical protein
MVWTVLQFETTDFLFILREFNCSITTYQTKFMTYRIVSVSMPVCRRGLPGGDQEEAQCLLRYALLANSVFFFQKQAKHMSHIMWTNIEADIII